MAAHCLVHARARTDLSMEVGVDSKACEADSNDIYNKSDKSSEASEKGNVEVVTEAGHPVYHAQAGDHFGEAEVVHTAKDIATYVLYVDDDKSLNPWTFRMFFIGSGLATFASVLQEIYYFKPQIIFVSVVFLTVISYVLGEAFAFAVPRRVSSAAS